MDGASPLDFSLQLAGGIASFRAWVATSFPDKAPATSDVPPFKFKVDEQIPGSELMSHMFRLQRETGAAPMIAPHSPFMRGED